MPRKLQVTVDHEVCVGNAMCETYASKVFVMNEDLQSEVADSNGDTEENILEAAENCPVSAITVIDLESGEKLFP